MNRINLDRKTIIRVFFITLIGIISYSSLMLGELTNATEISTVEDLQNMNNNLNGNYVLVNDIDASDTVNWNDGKGFDPIGTNENKFKGNFDGNGYTISNLDINRPGEDYNSVFGIMSGAEISNVNFDNLYVSGNSFTSGLGSVTLDCVFSDIDIDCEIRSDGTCGGIIALVYSNTDIINVNANVLVSVNPFEGTTRSGAAGGLAGDSSSGLIVENSKVSGEITGSIAGGIVGAAENCIVTNSYSLADIYTLDSSTSVYELGGIVGRTVSNVQFTDVYTSSNLYERDVKSLNEIHAFVGNNAGTTFSSCYYNSDVSHYDDNHATGLTSSQMQDESNFDGWDFENIWVMNTYPELQIFVESDDSGETESTTESGSDGSVETENNETVSESTDNDNTFFDDISDNNVGTNENSTENSTEDNNYLMYGIGLLILALLIAGYSYYKK